MDFQSGDDRLKKTQKQPIFMDNDLVEEFVEEFLINAVTEARENIIRSRDVPMKL